MSSAEQTELRPWPADKIERWTLDRIKPYPHNPMQHSPEQVTQLAASMKRFGVTTPILVDEDGIIIYGHGRVLAAKQLGFDVLPVAVAEGWTEDEKKAYRIADNQLARISEWDLPMLSAEIKTLQLADFDLPLLGFPELKLVEFLEGVPGAGEPPAPTTAEATKRLAERFGIAPFSVMNAREGWWQDRKRAWTAIGIQSELGRGENLIGRSPQELFCHWTGIPYDEARKIVTAAMAEQGDAFDLEALVAKHGGRRSKGSGADFSGVRMSETVQRLKPSADQAAKNIKRRQATAPSEVNLGGEV